MEPHTRTVQRIAQAVHTLYKSKESFRIFHGSTNTTRPQHHERTVDISALGNILDVDKKTQTVLVEPNVPMDELVATTLKYGLVPPVVMEFPGITVGGGFAGTAGESSSFKHGYFSDTVNCVEMILGNGSTVRASRCDNPDLFRGASGALGTLGIVTLLEVRLIPAKRFVRVSYRSTRSVAETIDVVKREAGNGNNDFVDALLFSRSQGLVMVGQMIDDIPSTETALSFSRPWDPWYYLYLEQKASSPHQPHKHDDYIPLGEYLFRWDRGGFWVGRHAFTWGMIPFNRFTRWLLNDFMHTRMLYQALRGSELYFELIIQDLALPYSTAESFMNYAARELEIWPVWLCPLRKTTGPTFHPYSRSNREPMLNFGIWGKGLNDKRAYLQQNRRLEEVLQELGGRKVLYSQAFYTEDQFWRLYDKEWYDDLRKRYHGESMPSIYEKIKTSLEVAPPSQNLKARARRLWPVPGLLGVCDGIRSRDYLSHRRPAWRDNGT
ncbi:FAD-binding domain-containing protein [Xylariaceae sp. FL1272]|nr:FAD-binding domain-containing protein [Xylariaceae sp. FL1272]